MHDITDSDRVLRAAEELAALRAEGHRLLQLSERLRQHTWEIQQNISLIIHHIASDQLEFRGRREQSASPRLLA
jgi:hypothetical protein